MAIQRTQTDSLQAPIKWEPVDVTPRLKDGRTVIPDEAIQSVTKNYVALKGPLAVSPGALCMSWGAPIKLSEIADESLLYPRHLSAKAMSP